MSDNTKPTLKKCPFCGCTAHYTPINFNKNINVITCEGCGASTGLFSNLSGAIKAWNMRPKTTKLQIEAACQAMVKAISENESPHDIAKAALIAASEVE